MSRQQLNKGKYVVVFILSTLIFLAGIFLGNNISENKLIRVNEIEQDIRAQIMGVELQYELLAENPCSAVNSSPLTKELYELGDKLNFMENNLGVDHPGLIRSKEYYSMLELRQWLFLKKTKEKCGTNNTLILYFYSNRGDCDKCEEQGYVLTYIRKIYPDVRVYNFDINIENLALDTIKDIYIKSNDLPVIIIDDKTYYGFKDSEQLEAII